MIRCLLLSAITVATGMFANVQTVHAANPNLKFRIFAIMGGEAANNPLPPPDFTSSDSKALLTMVRDSPFSIRFADDAGDQFLAGTTWVRGGTTLHVTANGIEMLQIFWLDEAPRWNTLALTGPNRDAAVTDGYLIRLSNGGSEQPFRWYVSDVPCNDCLAFYVGAGFFTK